MHVNQMSGTVLVRLKGTSSFVPVTALSSVPVGSELDLTKGRIRLTSTAAGGATQTGVFYQGRAVVGQTRAAHDLCTGDDGGRDAGDAVARRRTIELQ